MAKRPDDSTQPNPQDKPVPSAAKGKQKPPAPPPAAEEDATVEFVHPNSPSEPQAAREPFLDFNLEEHPEATIAEDDIIVLGPESEPALDFEAVDAAPLNVDVGGHEHAEKEHPAVLEASDVGPGQDLVDIDWAAVNEDPKGQEPPSGTVHEAAPAEPEPVVEAAEATPAGDILDIEWPTVAEAAQDQETPSGVVHEALPAEPEHAPLVDTAEEAEAVPEHAFVMDEAEDAPLPPEDVPMAQAVFPAVPPASPPPVAKPVAPAKPPSMLAAALEATPATLPPGPTPEPPPSKATSMAPRSRAETMLATPQQLAEAGAEAAPEPSGKAAQLSPHGRPETMLAPPDYEKESHPAAAASGAAAPRDPKATHMAAHGKPETMLAPPAEAEALAHETAKEAHADARESTPDEPIEAVDVVSDEAPPASVASEAVPMVADDFFAEEEPESAVDAALAMEAHEEEAPTSGVEVISAVEDSSGILLAESASGIEALAAPPGADEVVTTEDVSDEDIESALHAPPGADTAEMSSGSLVSALLEEEPAMAAVDEESSSGVDLGREQPEDLLSEAAAEEAAAAALTEGAAEETVEFGTPGEGDALAALGGEIPGEAGEEAALAAGEEEAAEAEEEAAEEKPARKPRRTGAWLGGSVLGLLVGAAACVGLWLAGYEPPAKWKTMLGFKATTPAATVAATTVKDPNTFLAEGRFDEGLKAAEKLPNKTPDILAAQGQARLLSYLQEQRKKQVAVKAGDTALEEAKKELTGAADKKDPDGLFWLGQLQEATGDFAEAKKTYANGLSQFKDKPEARRFQAALDRLDSLPDAAKPAGDKPPEQAPPPRPVGRREGGFPTAGVALFLPVLQADVPPPAADKNDAEEAGYDFWKAMKLAKEQKYADASAALQKARTTHDQQRFLRLRKSQNPGSDPTEEIFLRACDELLAYWQVRNKLGSEGYLDVAKQTDPVKALDQLLADKKAAGPGVQPLIDKLKADKDVTSIDPDVKDLAKAVDVLLEVKNKAAEQLVAVKAALTDAKAVAADDKDLLPGLKKLIQERKDAGDTLTAVQDLLKPAQYITDAEPNAAKGVEKLLGDKKAADDKLQGVTATLTDVANKLTEAKFLAPGADNAALVKGVDRVIQDVRVVRYNAMSRTPQQMLDVWVALLQGQQNKDLMEKATVDADSAASQAADPEERAEAQCVAGLALRNQAKFAEARQALEKAVAFAGPAKKGSWQTFARQALRDLSEPNAFYVPRTEELWTSGQLDAALTLLATGLEAFPPDTKAGGQLLALRSLVALDKARAQASGKRVTAEALAAAQKDAAAAVAAGASAEGHYALGRLAEELRNWSKAQESYRQALNAPQPSERAKNRARLALARVLLKISEGGPATAPAPRPEPAGTGRWSSKPGPDQGARLEKATNPLATMLALLLVGAVDDVQAPALPASLSEARQLAEQIIKAGDPEGHIILAQILAREGRWTDALMEYVDGLPPAYGPGFRFIMSGHPAFRMPDTLNPPDPLRAEKHFSDGLHYYWARNYPAAERSLREALRFYDGDARYQYYLGLVWLQQGKRPEAIEAFRRGGLLERQSKPSTTEVNASLERVQGRARQVLNAESRR